MPMLAEVVDAVVGIDTHRDTHQVELAGPTGVPIADLQIPNSTAGFASLIGWLQTHRPGPEVVVGVEGTRGYGIGLTRALHAAGYKVVEVDPSLHRRRGKGKSDSIDAHQCVLAVLNMNLHRLPTPRSDGDREALRILLTAHNDMTLAWTATSNRLHGVYQGSWTGPSVLREDRTHGREAAEVQPAVQGRSSSVGHSDRKANRGGRTRPGCQ